MDLQRKIRAWLPLRKRPESLQISSSLNRYVLPTPLTVVPKHCPHMGQSRGA